jgi:hypothetical protein
MASTATFILTLFGLNYGLTLICPTLRAKMMRQYRLMTMGTSGDIRDINAIMGSSHIAFGF